MSSIQLMMCKVPISGADTGFQRRGFNVLAQIAKGLDERILMLLNMRSPTQRHTKILVFASLASREITGN